MRAWLVALIWFTSSVTASLTTGCVSTNASEPVIASRTPGRSQLFHGAWQDRPYPLPDETFRDVTGQPFNLRRSPTGPLTLLYFGYPRCAEVCTATLTDLAAALHRLDPGVRHSVTVLVIDIDGAAGAPPATRLPGGPALASWLRGFDPEFVGLRGDAAQVRRVADQVGVAIGPKAADGTILHGSQVIAFDSHDAGVLVWPHGTPPAHLAEDLTRLVVSQR